MATGGADAGVGVGIGENSNFRRVAKLHKVGLLFGLIPSKNPISYGRRVAPPLGKIIFGLHASKDASFHSI